MATVLSRRVGSPRSSFKTAAPRMMRHCIYIPHPQMISRHPSCGSVDALLYLHHPLPHAWISCALLVRGLSHRRLGNICCCVVLQLWQDLSRSSASIVSPRFIKSAPGYGTLESRAYRLSTPVQSAGSCATRAGPTRTIAAATATEEEEDVIFCLTRELPTLPYPPNLSFL